MICCVSSPFNKNSTLLLIAPLPFTTNDDFNNASSFQALTVLPSISNSLKSNPFKSSNLAIASVKSLTNFSDKVSSVAAFKALYAFTNAVFDASSTYLVPCVFPFSSLGVTA